MVDAVMADLKMEVVAAGLADDLAGSLRDYQTRYPLRWGMTKGELRNRFSSTPQDVFAAAVNSLAGAGRLFAREDRYRIDSPDLALSLEAARLKERVEDAYRRAGLNVPYAKELAVGTSEDKVNDVVQMLGNPLQVADPVVVRIGETAGIDLVQNGAPPPFSVGGRRLGGGREIEAVGVHWGVLLQIR